MSAMPRTQIHEQGRSLSASPAFRGFLIGELGMIALWVAWSLHRAQLWGWEPAWFPWVVGGHALLMLYTLVKSAGLWAGAMVWHRRLAALAVVAVVWRGSPLEHRWTQVLTILYVMLIWIVYLLESKRVALAVSEATGEEVFKADPTRRVD